MDTQTEIKRRTALREVRQQRDMTATAHRMALGRGDLAATRQCEELDAALAETEARLDGGRRTMAESGVPILDGIGEGQMGATVVTGTLEEAFAEGGVPMREATSAASQPQLLREEDHEPVHALVRRLDEAVPSSHSDRGVVDRLRSKGAALSGDDAHDVLGLALKHLPAGTEASLEDTRESASWRQALVDSGCGDFVVGPLPERSAPSAEDTLEAALLEGGVPMRAA